MGGDEDIRLELIAETIALLVNELTDGRSELSERARGDLLWFRLGRLSRLWSELPADLRDRHPDIEALGLPNEDETLSGLPRPSTAEVGKLAGAAARAFRTIVALLPP